MIYRCTFMIVRTLLLLSADICRECSGRQYQLKRVWKLRKQETRPESRLTVDDAQRQNPSVIVTYITFRLSN